MKQEGTLPKLKHPRKDGEQGGFPRFKSKKRDRLSFYLANDKFSVDGHTIRIPKLGTLNMTEALRFQGKIMSAVISSRAGWWFVSISVEVEHEVPTHNGEVVGIDLGIKTLATCSDGVVFENQKHYRQNLGRIKGLSKGLSRKGEGSRNWWKNTQKLAKAHYRAACQRQDTVHKMTTSLSRNYALIGLEDLTLDIREWICEQCEVVHERDLNASLNIRDEALRLITDVPVVASSGQKFACGAGSAGSRCVEGETSCDEAGTKVL